MDVVSAFVVDGQATEAAQPSVCAHDDPAVTSEALAAFHPAPGDAGLDATGAAHVAAARVVVALIGVQLVRSPPSSTASAAVHQRDGVQHGHEHLAIALVGRSGQHAERRAPGINDDVACCPADRDPMDLAKS